MLSVLLPPTLVGIIAFTLILASLVAAFCVFLPFALLKFLVPIPAFRRACTDVLFAVARQWAANNKILYRVLYPVQWEIEINGELDPRRSYLLISNHQSWLDIMLLFDQFHHRLPPLCFFLKRELAWVPIIGLACWAMDFPFMKRYTRDAIEKDASLKDQDLEATRRACEKFREHPATVVNFVEGTRFTEAKRVARQSPYRHLLRPKATGLSFALNTMGDQFAGILDITIAYRPSPHPILWSFMMGEQTQLIMQVNVLPVPLELAAGDYQTDAEFRARFQAWVNALWARKDARLDRMLPRPTPAVRPRTT